MRVPSREELALEAIEMRLLTWAFGQFALAPVLELVDLPEEMDWEEDYQEDSGPLFNALPDELILKIFHRMDSESRLEAASCCRRFSRIAKDQTLWLDSFSSWLGMRELFPPMATVDRGYPYLFLNFHRNMQRMTLKPNERDFLGLVEMYPTLIPQLHCLDLSCLEPLLDADVTPLLSSLIAKSQGLEIVRFNSLRWAPGTWSVAVAGLLSRNPFIHTLDFSKSTFTPVHMVAVLESRFSASLKTVIVRNCRGFAEWKEEVDGVRFVR